MLAENTVPLTASGWVVLQSVTVSLSVLLNIPSTRGSKPSKEVSPNKWLVFSHGRWPRGVREKQVTSLLPRWGVGGLCALCFLAPLYFCCRARWLFFVDVKCSSVRKSLYLEPSCGGFPHDQLSLPSVVFVTESFLLPISSSYRSNILGIWNSRNYPHATVWPEGFYYDFASPCCLVQ